MSIAAERAVLGAMIKDNSLISDLVCDPEDFAEQSSAEIFTAMRDLVNGGEVADIVTVSDHLKSQSDRDYMRTLADLVYDTPGTVNAQSYYKMMKSTSRVRRARGLAEELQNIQDPNEVEAFASRLMAMCREHESHVSSQTKSVRDAIDHLERLQEGAKPGLPTGLTALDEKLGGLQPSDLVVIAARSQHGKTALMMHMANSQSVPVGIISGEQPSVQLGLRSLAMVGDVSLKDMRTGQLTDNQWSRIGDAAQQLHDRNVYIYDRGNPTISEVEVQARQWCFHNGVKVLFVDFLQLIAGGAGEEHRLQVGDVVYRLKALAKQLKIPVVALAQVARRVDSMPEGNNFMGRMPYTSHIADSAKIEDAADQIMTLYRPEVYWPTVERMQGIAYLNVCKNRHGPTGFVSVKWIGEYVQFKDRAA